MKVLTNSQSGSYAGVTASRNKYGQYFRRRSAPVNPNTATQAAIRTRMTYITQLWRALTAAQKAGWGDLGSQMNRSDALGTSYTLTGAGAFNSINMRRVGAGDAVVSDAPALTEPVPLLTMTLTLTNVAFSIAYTTTPLAAGVHAEWWCSPQLSPGVIFNADYRQIAITAAAAASPTNILAAYTTRFGAPVTGNKIFVQGILYQAGFPSGKLLVAQVVA